jgi:hypothetical protein
MIDLSQLSFSQKAFTVSIAAWLVQYFDRTDLWNADLRQSLVVAVAQACLDFRNKQKAQSSNIESMNRRDPRIEQILEGRSIRKPVRVFTDYEVLLYEVTLLSDHFELVDNMESADFIFTTKQTKDFLNFPINQRICQFPYESALIRKDLLPLTVRQFCYQADGNPPNWWLPCFDLSTEFHLFAEEHSRRTDQGLSNRWILKPAVGTRGMGHRIIEEESKEGLHFAAVLAPPINDIAIQKIAGVKKLRS